MMAERATLRDVELIDLPTGHWPMWSRPADLACACPVVDPPQDPAPSAAGPIARRPATQHRNGTTAVSWRIPDDAVFSGSEDLQASRNAREHREAEHVSSIRGKRRRLEVTTNSQL